MSKYYELIKSNIIEFDRLLLDKYHQLNLNEVDTILLIKIHNLIKQGITFLHQAYLHHKCILLKNK